MAQKSNYRLKNGVVIRYKGMPYTHINITDEVASAYLKEHPGHASRFDVIPSKEQLAKEEKEIATVEKLKEENKALKAEIKALKAELKKAEKVAEAEEAEETKEVKDTEEAKE